MKLDWVVNEPIDFEYHEYKILAYFQKVAQDLDEFKLYPHFRDISLGFANYSNLKSKDRYIKILNNIKDIDDEILLSDLEFCDIPKMSTSDYNEYRTIVEYGEDKFKSYFMIAKSVWSIIYESIWVHVLENEEQIKRNRGFVFFEYGGKKHLYRYHLKSFVRNKKEKKIHLKKVKISEENIDIREMIAQDSFEKKTPGHPLFILKIKNNINVYIPLENTILPLIKRRIFSFTQKMEPQKNT